MAKARSVSLVIDASVAQAAGPEEATHPTSKHCRDFLLAVGDTGHRMTFTALIEGEWNNHQSGFARRWRQSMFARKTIDRVAVGPDETLREQLEEWAPSEKTKEAMLKDAHLIEAARASQRRVAALDEVVRNHFRGVAPSVPRLLDICWVNPAIQSEMPIEWLRARAPADSFRMLGHVPVEE